MFFLYRMESILNRVKCGNGVVGKRQLKDCQLHSCQFLPPSPSTWLWRTAQHTKIDLIYFSQIHFKRHLYLNVYCLHVKLYGYVSIKLILFESQEYSAFFTWNTVLLNTCLPAQEKEYYRYLKDPLCASLVAPPSFHQKGNPCPEFCLWNLPAFL